jgi:methionyl-tRNA formyltransferase
VLVAERDCLFIQTGEGVLRILQLQPAGKKVLSADTFLRGYRVKAGDYFGPLAEPSSDR